MTKFVLALVLLLATLAAVPASAGPYCQEDLGYGRTSSSGVGFQGTGSAAKPEEYAGHLLELYGRCLTAVQGKK